MVYHSIRDRYVLRLCSCLISLVVSQAVMAQYAEPSGKDDVGRYVDFELDVSNNHLWRGIEVSDGLVMTTTLAVHDTRGHVRVGLWGGTNASGDYKEFNYFAEFKAYGWKLSFWDTMNFSPTNADAYNTEEFFNYSAHTTGRFLDASLSYTLPCIPLGLSWSTVIFGRDRYAANGETGEKSDNRYSTFVYADYRQPLSASWSLDAGIGGAFCLNHRKSDSSTFYSDRPGIIHIQLQVSHDIRVTRRYPLPVFVKAVWNPVMNRSYLQIGAHVCSF